jgi:hypothetical protein
MGLLVNPAGSSAETDVRGDAAPVTDEESMYLTEFPRSCSTNYNGNPDTVGGTYTWIVGKNGKVYGAYQKAVDEWYAGFSGNYP